MPKLPILALVAASIAPTLLVGAQGSQTKADQQAEAAAQAILPRFSGVFDRRFGLTRAVMPGAHKMAYIGGRRMGETSNQPRLIFVPDSDAQRQLVRDLKSEGADVAFYTVGLCSPDRFRGPAYMVDYHQSSAPDTAKFTRALETIKKNPAAKDRAFKVGTWSFYARPVTATVEKCAGCHNSQEHTNRYKVGSTLGVLLVAVDTKSIK
jgi:hypothetical protein